MQSALQQSGVAGLVAGLLVHPATAWFAVFELGIPASILGGLLGLASGAIAFTVRSTVGRERTFNSESNR
jgi:thiol:disulfide interchange protein